MTRALLSFPVLLLSAIGACTGDIPTLPEEAGVVPPATPVDDASSSSGEPDANDSTCYDAAVCNGDSVVRCGVTVNECALGCLNEPAGARCRRFDPTGTPTATDLEWSDLEPLILNDDFVFDTDGGGVSRIEDDGRQSIIRAVGTNGVSMGIGYRRLSDRGVFAFRTFEVAAGVRRNFNGRRALTIVADTIRIRGPWFLPCGRVGGGSSLTPGPGAGREGSRPYANDVRVGGGGGAGHAVRGGVGLKTVMQHPTTGQTLEGAPGAPGNAYGGPPFDSLFGGSLGGLTNGGVSRVGGEGGAAVQLIALKEIVVGASDGSLAGISVGGCGGKTPREYGGGGGGGSGGTLLLEAPSIRILPGAILAANGGGGGASLIPDDYTATTFPNEPAHTANPHLSANDGSLTLTAAGRRPDDSSLRWVYGGRGGSAETPNAADLNAVVTPYWTGGTSRQVSGPGGGGSVGYIHLYTRDGVVGLPGSVASPSIAPFFGIGVLTTE